MMDVRKTTVDVKEFVIGSIVIGFGMKIKGGFMIVFYIVRDKR